MRAFPDLPAKPLAALLAAVHAQPEADEPRLALADWLEAQGDPRAAFIRIQCELARLDARFASNSQPPRQNSADDARHAELQQANRTWIRKYQTAWLGKISDPVKVRWDRGLPSVRISEGNLQSGWSTEMKRNLDQGWLAELELHLYNSDGSGITKEWAAQKAVARRLRQVTAVSMNSGCYEPALRAIAPMVWLRRLGISEPGLDDAAMEHLQGMQELRDLDLPGPHGLGSGLMGVTGPGFRALAGSRVLAHLRRLTVSGCRLTDEDLEHLAGAPLLEKLCLSFYPAHRLAADGITVRTETGKKASRYPGSLLKLGLKALNGLPRLQDLELTAVDIWKGKWPLTNLPELKRLRLYAGTLTDDGLEPITKLIRLEELMLDYFKFTGAGLKHLAKLPELRRLGMRSWQKFQTRHLRALADFPALEALDLAHTHFAPTGLKDLGRLSGLRYLDLNGVYIREGTPTTNPPDLTELANLAKLERIRLPNFSSADSLRPLCGIAGLRSVSLNTVVIDERIMTLLASMKQLRHLTLWDCTLSPEMHAPLADLVQLESLEMYGGQLGDDGLRYLSALTSLTCLDLNTNGITDAGLNHLAKLPSLQRLCLHELFLTRKGLKILPPGIEVEAEISAED